MDDFLLVAPVELRASGEADPVQVNILAYTGGVLNLSGWYTPVVVDLAGLRLPETIPLLADHENNLQSVAGSGSPVSDGKTLRVEGKIAPTSPAGKLVLDLARSGVKLQASIGATAKKTIRVADTDLEANGQKHSIKGSVIHVIESELKEVSIVAIGADGKTSVTVAAKAAERTGMSTDIEAAVAAERSRVKKIEELCGGEWGQHSPRVADLRAKAIDGAITVEELQTGLLATLRAGRPNIDTVPFSRQAGGPDQAATIEASFALSCGLSESFAGKHFDERVMNAALSRANRGMSLQGLLRASLQTAGRSAPTGRFNDGTIRAAFEADQQIRASGVSTFSVPGILSNTANKLMLEAFNGMAITYGKFTKKGTNPDFKSAARYRLTAKGSFQKIAPGGEIKHISLEETSYSAQLETYGAMIAIDRKDIINDDLNAFAAVPKLLGRQSAIKVERSVYELLLSNPSTFFGAGNKNYISGATTVLSSGGLQQGFQKFVEQVDANNDPILIRPSILLVPPALETVARELTISQHILLGMDQEGIRGSTNIWNGLLEPVTSPYLGSAAALSGASDVAWYLLAGSGDYAVIEVAFLNGVQAPTVETAQLDFNVLGVQMRAYHDFGVNMLDHRGGVKSKGAA